MKQRKAQSRLDNIIKPFAGKMSCLTFDAMFSAAAIEKARNEWASSLAFLKKHSKPEDTGDKNKSFHSMWSRLIAFDARVYPPNAVVLDPYGARDEELIAELIDNYNRQCNWLFVTAYESYEKLLKDIYAALGYLDHGFWKCADFGDIPVDAIPKLKEEWFSIYMREKRSRFTPEGIIKNIRNRVPVLSKYEANGDLHLHRWINIAAFYRHIIVHSQGNISQEECRERLQQITGYSLASKDIEVRMFWHSVYNYIETVGDDYRITMIDKKAIGKQGRAVYAPFESLVLRVASHGLLVYSSLAEHFGFVPYWENKTKP